MARTTSGEQLVDGMEASEETKARLNAILDNLAGTLSVEDAGRRVGLGVAMFHRIRTEALLGAAAALAPKASGRPRKTVSDEARRIAELEQEVARLQVELAMSRVREEIAVMMPHLLERSERNTAKKAPDVAEGFAADSATSRPSADNPAPALVPETIPAETACEVPGHRERMLRACRLRGMAKKPRAVNGVVMQAEHRGLELEIRKVALGVAEQAVAVYGLSWREVAERMGIPESTLRSWKERARRGAFVAAPRGRRSNRPDALTRTAVLVVYYIMGPGVGVPTVQDLLPDVTRAAIENLLKRYKRMTSRRKRRLIRALRWLRPGAVWAMDYTEAPAPIDGCFRWILAVRDLSSGVVLLALPVMNATAQATCDALTHLFRTVGIPLVIKCDNGGHFVGEPVGRLLDRVGVTPLLSPVALPEYNGAIEAGIGSLKTRTHFLAARHGRPGQWTCDDVEGARIQANLTGRPRGLTDTTPQQAWLDRTPIETEERNAFDFNLDTARTQVRGERGYLPGIEIDDKTKAALERMAIVRALMQSAYLEIRRGRLPLQESTAARA